MSAPSRKMMEISLGALFVVALAMLAYMATRMGSLAGFGDVVAVSVRFEDASGLVEDAAVKIAGVEVGRVKKLSIDFDSAVAQLQLNRSADVRVDAVVAIRARSLLGEKYVELQPQSRDAAPIEDGAVLQAAPAGLEIEELASLLGPTLEGMQLEALSSGAQDVLAMAMRQEDPIRSILVRMDSLLKRAETVQFDDPTLMNDLKVAVANLRTTSERLPGLASQAEQTLGRTDSIMQGLEPTISRINTSAEQLPATMAQVNEALERVNRLLVVLEPQARRLEDLDYAMVRYLFRNEGLLIRLAERDVPQFEPGFEWGDAPRSVAPPTSGAPSSPPPLPASQSGPMSQNLEP